MSPLSCITSLTHVVQRLPCSCSNDSCCAAGPSSEATHHSASPKSSPALQIPDLSSAPASQQAAFGGQSVQQAAGTDEAGLQQNASSPSQVNDPRPGFQAHAHGDPHADPPARPQADQHNPPTLSHKAANQNLQQHHDKAQQLQQPFNSKQQLQQHGDTSDAPQTATEATLARPGPHTGLRQPAGESANGTHQSAEPVAVFTSAVTGAGLRELLLQVERKVWFLFKCCRPQAEGAVHCDVVGLPCRHC